MIYLLFLVALLLICCNPDQAKDNSKDETIEYFIPLSQTYFTKSETSPSSKRTYTSALMTF